MSKIRIVNWLLTRKCNLKCDYCSIVKNYEGMPEHYPKMKYYHQNQMTSFKVIEILNTLNRHNKDIFNIFYGGEPTLFDGLSHVINHCNNNNIYLSLIHI